MIRTTAHARLLELAEHATVPVINGLTDETHPCQIMADVMTFEEHRGPSPGRTFAWTGDGNNVLHSLLEASARFSFKLNVAVPEGSEPGEQICRLGAGAMAARSSFTRSAEEAVRRRRLRGHRHLGVDGPGASRARPQRRSCPTRSTPR